MTTGNHVCGALKGRGIHYNPLGDSEKRFAEVHRNYIYGGHIAAYMRIAVGSSSLCLRIMVRNFPVKVCHLEETFLMMITPSVSFSDIVKEITIRFPWVTCGKYKLRYTIPGHNHCQLISDYDLSMLSATIELYELKDVTVNVVEELSTDASTLQRNAVSIEDSGSVVIQGDSEDEYLDIAFRNEKPKNYLSREWCHLIEKVGQKFLGGAMEFRLKLSKYAIETGFLFDFKRNDSRCIEAVCSKRDDHQCMWHIKCSKSTYNNIWYILKMNNVHTCRGMLRGTKSKLLTADIVKSEIINDIRMNPGMKAKEIMKKFYLDYGFEIPYKTAYRGKEKAVKSINGGAADSYNMLVWYQHAVLESDPGSVFVLECDPETNRFKRLFVAYGGCIRGFEFCIPVLFVDGTFGKSIYKGQLLCGTGKNGNGGFFPLALAICDSETDENWSFFFENLKSILEPQGRVVTFISDRGVGLCSAFDRIFPNTPHSFCYKHLVDNLLGRFKGAKNALLRSNIQTLFMKVAYACNERAYQWNLNNLLAEGGEAVREFLEDLPLQKWCRAFFFGNRYGEMANSLAESFNSWIVVERGLPVYEMLDSIRVRVMEQISTRHEECRDWVTYLCPAKEKLLKENLDISRAYVAVHSVGSRYEIRGKFDYSVDISNWECSCGKWLANWFPCPHGICAVQASGNNLYGFVDPYYTAECYRMSYSFGILPISNVDQQFIEASLSSSTVRPPMTKKPPGRPKGKRFKSHLEGKNKGKKKMITCSRCGQLGDHNRTTCTAPIAH